MLEHFVADEPLCRVLKMSPKEADVVVGDVVNACLQKPISYAIKNEEDRIVAARLCHFLDRPKKNEVSEGPNYESWKANKIFNFLRAMEEKVLFKILKIAKNPLFQIWDLIPPEVNTVMNISMLAVDQNYTRRGFGLQLLEHNLKDLKNYGCKDVTAECTALYSQNLLINKFGCKPIYDIFHKEWLDEEGKMIFECDDGTNRGTLVYKHLD
ncbi:hypothetical protein L596_013252 [Steinernema carpocapsae]|uniref:N-acetyltransferase domain-containing protein n=1 Tax=Steinernema carpocapsae TaxID=34508 RepID=A0A4U5P040_STECR|nr:hypothetical protein L596_013252 [Steinernema carpocapsae]